MSTYTPNAYYSPQNLDLARSYGLPVETVDDAIRNTLEHTAQVEGWPGVPDLNPLVWLYIQDGVLTRLSDHVQMGEVAA